MSFTDNSGTLAYFDGRQISNGNRVFGYLMVTLFWIEIIVLWDILRITKYWIDLRVF